MGASSGSLHEASEKLKPETIDRHRAIVSIMEELEAIDWYDQRVDASGDRELAAILAHNRDEEKEHACMTLEWLRRRDPALAAHMKTYLFTEGSVLEIEEQDAAGEGGGEGARAPGKPSANGGGAEGSLGIGSLRLGGKRDE